MTESKLQYLYMIHECTVTFYQLNPFQFPNKNIKNSLDINEEQTLVLETKTTNLIFYMDDSQLCQLSARYVQSNPLKHGQKELTLFAIPDKNSNDLNPVVKIQGSKKCLQKISDLTVKNKPFKSTLAFIPSQVKHISLMSGQSTEQKYRGFLNLMGVMFIILNVRNIIENFRKYGIQFKQDPGDFIPIHTIFALFGLIIFPLTAFYIERIKFLHILPLKLCKIILKINIAMIIPYNIYYCRNYEVPPFIGVFYTSICMVLCLKLTSYLQVNSEVYSIIQRMQKPGQIPVTQSSQQKNQNHQKQKKKNPKNKNNNDKTKLTRRPSQADIENYVFNHYEISQYNLKFIHQFSGKWYKVISINTLFYFLFAPTLCYQLQYPRTTEIRKIWLLKRLAEFTLVSGLQVLLWFQYINPELSNLYQTIIKDDYTYLQLLNRHLRLAVPNCIMWVAGFYNFFHLLLNINAQVMRFGDRNFYMDWWNCRTLQQYWKTWNLPVHFWFIRHVYNPLLQRGFSKMSANLVVFLISAVAHEYVVSVPLKLITWWAFLGMVMQVPVIIIQKKFGKILMITNSQLGNVSFWISFCFVGQPIVVFIYYALYMKNFSENNQLVTPIPLDITFDT